MSKFRFARGGEQHTLHEIRSWDYGVLILSKDEGRGVDTRFKKSARVLIACHVDNLQELQQMIGRSSRSRGVCEGTLYALTAKRPSQVLDRLKRQGVTAL